LRPFTSLRIYWKLVKDPTLSQAKLWEKENICRDKSKAFYLCIKDQIRMVMQKDINLLLENTSDTITQRL